ncbi:MAG: hypothetical protein K5893_11955 [Prevotella sp.]|nr:hypothetical protein [Prevotella sp.]
MKKTILLIAIATLLCNLAAIASEPADGYILYQNDKFGFSMEIPSFLKLKNAADKDPSEGADYWRDPSNMWDINRISILANANGSLGDPYTPEKVKMDYELTIEDYEKLGEKACEDTRYFFTIPGDSHTTIECHVFSGMKEIYVVIDFDDDMAAQMGGDVARHVLNSIQFR